MSCVSTDNENWCKLTVVAKVNAEARGDYKPTSYWNDYDVTAMAEYEYIVVSGSPSASLDENGRKEIAIGHAVADSRLYGGYVVKEVVQPDRTALTSQYFTQTDNDTTLITTITITDGSNWSAGDIIKVKYR